MSKQWTIENDTGAELTVRAPNGFAVELDANSADPRERFAYFAIRQQNRDIESIHSHREAIRRALEAWDTTTNSKSHDGRLWQCMEDSRALVQTAPHVVESCGAYLEIQR